MCCNRAIKIVLISLLVVLVANTAATADNRPKGETRLLGGNIITVRNAPYIVQLRNSWGQFYCGGTLVSPKHVVTAAHCLDKMTPKDVVIVGGVSSIFGKGEKHEIDQWFIPDEYTRETKNMDIAVIKLLKELKGKNIEPLPLCSRPLQEGDLIEVSGWGKTSENGKVSELLRTVRFPVMSREECVRRHIRIPTKISESMICAAELGAKDSCTGDSGGPAVLGGELCGVVSWGIGCGRDEFPGIFTNVAVARDFLENALKS